MNINLTGIHTALMAERASALSLESAAAAAASSVDRSLKSYGKLHINAIAILIRLLFG
ncbi:hypothetical protein [Chitinophaga polysaccharea]|uniref:hypothetical protein n=1 Tax=Chitinophaga polysaccharea TaxID=1293035 RepID=UPI00163C8647|nr:hypothetical protein [Chitinophaga polysaccharea]